MEQRHLFAGLVLGIGLMLSAASWSIPMGVDGDFGLDCGDNCLPVSDNRQDMSDIQWMVKDAMQTFAPTGNRTSGDNGWSSWWQGWSNSGSGWSWNDWSWNGQGNGWSNNSNGNGNGDDDDNDDNGDNDDNDDGDWDNDDGGWDGDDDDDGTGIPEPGPLALIGLGLVILGLRRRLFSR